MDSRIEELASIIVERAEAYVKASSDDPRPNDLYAADKHITYRNIGRLAMDILFELQEHRQRFLELYK